MSRVRHIPHTVPMTQQSAPGNIPALTLGWRLKMALDHSDISVQAMANQLGVTRATLSRWMSDKGSRPKKAYLMQWALLTGVPFEWIETGRIAPPDPDGNGGRQHATSLGGSPTDQYRRLPLNRLVHLPRLGLVTAEIRLLPCPKFTTSTPTRTSLDLAA